MTCSKRFAPKLLAATIFLGLTGAASAGGLNADLAACPSNGTAIGDVKSCGKIWKLKSGHVHLASDGRLRVEVRGLVLNDESVGKFNGTPDGVDAVAAAVVCNGPNGAAVAAQADPVPLGKSGDARIDVKLSLPSACYGPVVVLRERYEGNIGGWLAATGM
ncbi:MAG TPA: hypothetical protein VFB20_12895 [Burkholderiales bacterium]|nr:hypothetical protein [Burkholderiales bacterium]